MPAGAANMLLVIATALLAEGAAPRSAPFDHEKSLIDAGLQRWRGKASHFDPEKGSFVCETRVTSGDKQIDKLACAATVTCFNRHRDELNAVLNMRGEVEAQHAASRRFRQTKGDCFRLESEPLVSELALRRVARGTR